MATNVSNNDNQKDQLDGKLKATTKKKNETTTTTINTIASSLPFITTIDRNDILLGRGAFCISHVGNVMFRDICQEYRDDYHNARRRCEKTKIAKHIVHMIASKGGRFLRKVDQSWCDDDGDIDIKKSNKSQGTLDGLDDDPHERHKNERVWLAADFDASVEKVKQTLREKMYQPKVRQGCQRTSAITKTGDATTTVDAVASTALQTPETKHSMAVAVAPPIRHKKRVQAINEQDDDDTDTSRSADVDRKRPATKPMTPLYYNDSDRLQSTLLQQSPQKIFNTVIPNLDNHHLPPTNQLQQHLPHILISNQPMMVSVSEGHNMIRSNHNVSFLQQGRSYSDTMIDNSLWLSNMTTMAPSQNNVDIQNILLRNRVMTECNRREMLRRYEEQKNLQRAQGEIRRQFEGRSVSDYIRNVSLSRNHLAPSWLSFPPLSCNNPVIERNTSPTTQPTTMYNEQLNQPLLSTLFPTALNQRGGNSNNSTQNSSHTDSILLRRINEMLATSIPDPIGQERLSSFDHESNRLNDEEEQKYSTKM